MFNLFFTKKKLLTKKLIKYLFFLFSHFPIFVFLFNTSNVKNVITPDENFAQTSGTRSVDKFFGLSELEVHVAVGRDEEPFVLVAPLQLDHDNLAQQAVEEGLRVHDGRTHLEGSLVYCSSELF